LSSLLFNIALEPFIRTAPSAPSLFGCPVLNIVRWDQRHNPATENQIKFFADVDDLIPFFRNPDEWNTLQSLLDDNGAASNAKINFSKTIMLSLTGQAHEEWKTLAQAEQIKWHACFTKYIPLKYAIQTSKSSHLLVKSIPIFFLEGMSHYHFIDINIDLNRTNKLI
jgi:hypothetical protein